MKRPPPTKPTLPPKKGRQQAASLRPSERPRAEEDRSARAGELATPADSSEEHSLTIQHTTITSPQQAKSPHTKREPSPTLTPPIPPAKKSRTVGPTLPPQLKKELGQKDTDKRDTSKVIFLLKKYH